MLHGMKRLSVQLDDATADLVSQQGMSASAYIARAVRESLLREAAAAAAAYERAHDDPAYEAQRLAGLA
jgi:hypothetical protein